MRPKPRPSEIMMMQVSKLGLNIRGRKQSAERSWQTQIMCVRAVRIEPVLNQSQSEMCPARKSRMALVSQGAMRKIPTSYNLR